ncbi:hypothetical protein, partial [Rhodococcus sp. T2V]|uniref:hypothetical protein n=1 Tax=Rhodococcus sp. T2V TaxID=3034164 RepID=UPI0023E28155
MAITSACTAVGARHPPRSTGNDITVKPPSTNASTERSGARRNSNASGAASATTGAIFTASANR